jgi:hypothetical protein
MVRTVVKVQTALRRARERELARAIALDSADPKVAAHAAKLAQARVARWERGRAGAGHARWLEGATAAVFAALDERRATPGPASQAAFEDALTALVGDAEGARFVAQCLELDPVEVRRIVGPLDVS